MRLSRAFASFTLFGAALLRCSSDGFTNLDAGTDAGLDAVPDTLSLDADPPRDGASDVADALVSDADAAPPPKCDPKKPFATPTKVLRNGLDVVVDVYGSFRIDQGETHAWLQENSVLRQYTLSANTITHDATVADLAVEQGFAVSSNGLDLVAAHAGGVVHHVRANLTSNWGSGALLPMPFSAPDGAAYQQFYYPYLSSGAALYVGRFVYYPSAPSEWDVVRVAGDAGAILSELHGGSFAFVSEPVLADERTMYLSRWGGGPVPHLARATRATTVAPWDQPQDVPLGSLVVGANDSTKPYAVTADDCTLYLGYALSVDGAFALSGPYVLYVARRPL